MLIIEQGINLAVYPRQDLELGDVTILQLIHQPSNKSVFCKVEDLLDSNDWIKLQFEVVAASAIALDGQITLHPSAKGDYRLNIYSHSVYSENPKVMQLIKSETVRYV